MEACQLTGSLVIVVLALVAGQISGVLFLSVGVSLVLALGMWLVDALLPCFGVRTFARERLLARLSTVGAPGGLFGHRIGRNRPKCWLYRDPASRRPGPPRRRIYIYAG